MNTIYKLTRTQPGGSSAVTFFNTISEAHDAACACTKHDAWSIRQMTIRDNGRWSEIVLHEERPIQIAACEKCAGPVGDGPVEIVGHWVRLCPTCKAAPVK